MTPGSNKRRFIIIDKALLWEELVTGSKTVEIPAHISVDHEAEDGKHWTLAEYLPFFYTSLQDQSHRLEF